MNTSRSRLIVESILCGAPITVAALYLISTALIVAIGPSLWQTNLWLASLATISAYSLYQYWRVAIKTIRGLVYPFDICYYLAATSAAISSLALAFFMPLLLFLVALAASNASKLLRIQWYVVQCKDQSIPQDCRDQNAA